MKTGQFDDLDGAAWRAISDDDLPEDEDKNKK
jgi:cbb3-type cytochrome oxidase maturation protein